MSDSLTFFGCYPRPLTTLSTARLTPIEGRELRALCLRENDELLVLHGAYEESVQDGIFGGDPSTCDLICVHVALANAVSPA